MRKRSGGEECRARPGPYGQRLTSFTLILSGNATLESILHLKPQFVLSYAYPTRETKSAVALGVPLKD